jgi:hypothetical protein
MAIEVPNLRNAWRIVVIVSPVHIVGDEQGTSAA